MKNIYVLLFFTYSTFLYSQNDTIKKDSIILKEVILISESKIKLKQDKGKYIANVINTDFQRTQNTWEGLKLIPMLRVNDNEGLKVKFKNAIVEINGNQIQLSGFELESYLKSLDPKTIKRIEILSNPNASYGSEIEAVINILLSQNSNNYRLASNVTNGTRKKYFNSSNINLNYNLEKLKLYSSYSFNYNQKVNESEIISQTGNNPLLKFDYNENTYQKNHQYYVNLNYEINKNNAIDITTTGSFHESSGNGLGENTNFRRVLETNSNNKKIQLAEIYNYSFNDSTFLKIGAYQVFNTTESSNFATTNTTSIENQKVVSKIPLIVGFGDFSKSTKIGEITIGTRLNFTSINKDNFSIDSNLENNNPYNYNEKIISTYINNSLIITEKASLSLGLRLESSFINYKFSDTNNIILLEDNLNYSNLLYNINYMYSSEKEWHHAIAFRKQIQRPNYSYLNPFLNLNSDITYFSGDTKIQPSKLFSFNYEVLKKNWSLYIQTGMINDFISTFTDQVDNKIVETYKNFDTVLLSGFGFEYNPTLIKKIWYSRINFDFTYFKIKDKNYPNIKESSPNTTIEVSNIFKIKNYQLNLKYNLTPTYRDGLYKHFQTQRLDFTISKKINNNLSLFIYAYDILKTNINWEETTLTNYFYSSKNYNDQRTFGLSLRWNITGKAYTKNEIEKIEDNTIDRL
jgi:hypothetical protein